MNWYQWRDNALLLSLRIQPRASKDELVGPHGGHLKVRITTPPVDGKANEHLLKFLAKTFGIAKSQISLISGKTSREKRVLINSPKKIPPVIPPQENG